MGRHSVGRTDWATLVTDQVDAHWVAADPLVSFTPEPQPSSRVARSD